MRIYIHYVLILARNIIGLLPYVYNESDPGYIKLGYAELSIVYIEQL